MSTWEPIDDRLRPATEATQPEGPLVPCSAELEAPLTRRQLKCRRNNDSKLAKKFKNLEAEIDNLKFQMDNLKDKITKASESTNARFRRKKIRSMKREADKIAEKLAKSETKLELIEPRVKIDPLNCGVPLKLHLPNRPKCIEAKIAKIKKKIRRVKNKKNKECLIAKREALATELNWKFQAIGRSIW